MSIVNTLRGILAAPARRSARATIATIQEPSYRRKYRQSIADWIIYHQEKIHFHQMTWMGVKVLKNPMDCWIYQEILHQVRPDVVVEIGSLAGGSTLFFCHLLDLIGHGQVVSVDKDRSRYRIKHTRLRDITGDCSDPAVVAQVQAACHGSRVLIIHDADHSKQAVLRDLRNYADLVTLGSYFIVEDGIVDVFTGPSSKRLRWDNRPGPLAAIREFLLEDNRFTVDNERERYLITSNPCGFLKRVA